jgi:uncharacterized protein (DUF983 family)
MIDPGVMRKPTPKLKTLIWRGWCRKCPECGQGDLYQRWLQLHEYCPVCGLQYLPNQGDLMGPLMFLDRVLFLIPLIVVFYFGMWHPTLTLFLVSCGILTLLLVFTTPHRNGVSLAIDYLIRCKEGDLAHRPPPTNHEEQA